MAPWCIGWGSTDGRSSLLGWSETWLQVFLLLCVLDAEAKPVSWILTHEYGALGEIPRWQIPSLQLRRGGEWDLLQAPNKPGLHWGSLIQVNICRNEILLTSQTASPFSAGMDSLREKAFLYLYRIHISSFLYYSTSGWTWHIYYSIYHLRLDIVIHIEFFLF